MALQPPKYTEDQRAAIRYAVLDAPAPVSVPEACRLAAAGELRRPDGTRLDAWQMHQGTARDYVARERRRRAAAARAAQPVDTAAAGVAGEVIALAADHVAAMKRRRRKLTAREIREAAAMVRETLALSRAAELEPPTRLDAPIGDTAPAGQDTGALAAAAAEIAAQDPPPRPSPHGEAETDARSAPTQNV